MKVIRIIIDVIIGIVAGIAAILGLESFKKRKSQDDSVQMSDVKPGTTIVKPKKINKNLKTQNGDKIKAPIPEKNVKEVIKNKLEAVEFKKEHKNLSDILLKRIKELKDDQKN